MVPAGFEPAFNTRENTIPDYLENRRYELSDRAFTIPTRDQVAGLSRLSRLAGFCTALTFSNAPGVVDFQILPWVSRTHTTASLAFIPSQLNHVSVCTTELNPRWAGESGCFRCVNWRGPESNRLGLLIGLSSRDVRTNAPASGRPQDGRIVFSRIGIYPYGACFPHASSPLRPVGMTH